MLILFCFRKLCLREERDFKFGVGVGVGSFSVKKMIFCLGGFMFEGKYIRFFIEIFIMRGDLVLFFIVLV